MFLAFRVTYLTKVHRIRGSYAALGGSPEGLDFPPHPIRLHAALVNAWARGGKDSDERRALEWLEELEPPLVLSPRPAGSPAHRRVYVPPNDSLLPNLRAKQPLDHVDFPIFPPEVVYAYRLPEGRDPRESPGRWTSRLEALASRITYLGTSRNLVWVAVSLEEEVGPQPALDLWEPGKGFTRFRVAFPGFLQEVERHYVAGHRFVPYRFFPYHRKAFQEPETRVHPSPWEFVVRFSLEPALPLEWAALFTHALRRALLSHLPSDAPPVLTGHDSEGEPLQEAHLAFMPLPYVGPPYGDGRVLGVAFLLPKGTDPGVKALLRDRARSLTRVEMPGGCKVKLARPDGRWTLSERRWRKPARRFASVLPVILDRYPKRGQAAAALAQSAKNAGFPVPIRSWISPVSPILGTVPSRRVVLPPGLSGFVNHAGVEFSEPVEGPILLGRGRYLGLGLFVPLPEEEDYGGDGS